jgi:hypothetical protein
LVDKGLRIPKKNMEIKPTEIYPFTLEASALRQNKATDGESEGSWRLDLIIKNVGKSKRAKIGY